MICFGAETDQEVKEKVTYESHFKIKIKNKNKNKIKSKGDGRERTDQFFFFSLSLLSSIYGNRTVRIRRGKKQSDVLDEGYAKEPKTRDFAEFLIKIRKILYFGFSQIYGFLPVIIGRSRRSN